MPGGGSSGGSQTTSNVPWTGVQPQLDLLFRGAEDALLSGELGAIGDESQRTLDARELAAQYARGGGSGLTPQAQGLAGQTLSGDFLTGETNPYLQGAISYAQEPVIQAWEERVMPRLDATFAGTAGGLGSGAYAAARERSARDLGRDLAGAATQAGYQNYATERGRQLATMGQAPGLDQAGYQNFAQLGRIGAAEDARAALEAGVPYQRLRQHSSLIQPGLGFGLSTTDQQRPDRDWLSTGIGLAGLAAAPFTGGMSLFAT